jgi:signal transduction histidine kinase
MAEILKREAAANAGVQAHAETIAKAAMQMFTLINEILESAHIESGNLELKQGKVDLDKVVQVVVYENQIGAAEKGQTFRLVCDEGCFMYGDWVRIKEVVGNLVNNAIKFSPGGTAIEVRVKRNSGKVRIEVQDQGPGLTVADKKKIFGKFQRLSNRPTGSETTTGLGLSIAKQLVELHRGRIWVESETGQGCLFIVEFPLWAKQ